MIAAPVQALRRVSERTPLRTKLITAVLVLVIMALVAISIASVYMLRNYVTTQHDTDLQSQMNFVTTTQAPPPYVTPGTAAVARGSNIVEGLQEPGHQLTWAQTENLPTANNLDPLPLLPTNGLWTGTSGAVSTLTVPAQAGTHTWRVKAETVNYGTPGNTQTVIFIVAEDLGDVNALTLRLVLFDLVVGGAIVIVLAVVAVGVVRANLRPLDDIELTAGQIAQGHLDHRVPEGDPRTEVGSLGRSLNSMLSQIESAFHAREASEQAAHQSEERMRRFIADASHELRTPLTTIRGFAAHYRQRGGADRFRLPTAAGSRSSFRTGGSVPPDGAYSGSGASGGEGLTPEELDHLMGRVEAEATRMGLLVEDLLTLARLDQQRPLAKAPVDLLTLAADAVQDARIIAPGRPIDLVVAPGTAFIVDGDEPRLRQVVANLVNNALTHTPDSTAVRVKIAPGTVQAGLAPMPREPGDFREFGTSGEPGTPGELASGEAGRTGEADLAREAPAWAAGTGPVAAVASGTVPAVVLDVADDGPGMTAEASQRVFERFYRADAARNRASGGTGLGLAIVAGLVAAHGGTVSVRTAPGQGADFRVKLPLSPDVLAAAEDAEDEPPV
jgi:two-component system, OmpR family, sensor kinase